MAALDGLRVVDLSRIIAGPLCAMLLGDHGADVVKVEPPSGDDCRTWGPPFLSGESLYFLSFNRNKRGIVLNLREPEGRAVLLRLLETADILVENFKSGTMERWGLDYDSLHQRNTRLIYLSIAAFGREGPYRDLLGYDALAQAMSGLMSVTGEPEGEPMRCGLPISDLTSGILGFAGALLALQHRTQTGLGQRVDLSLLGSTVSLLTYYATLTLNTGRVPARVGNSHPYIVPYQAFRCADGHIFVTVGNDEQFKRFCEALDLPDLAKDPRFGTNVLRVQNRAELLPALEERIARGKVEEWVAALRAVGVGVGPVQNTERALADPQMRLDDMVVEMGHPTVGSLGLLGSPLKLEASPASFRRHPPLLGEHTRELLEELGYTPEQVEELVARGIAVGA